MSVSGLKPTFTDKASYKAWKGDRELLYKEASRICKARKTALRDAQRRSLKHIIPKLSREYHESRIISWKLNSLLIDGKIRRDKILAWQNEIKESQEIFPLKIQDCRVVDIHFNKKHLEFSFIPMWVIKTKGKQYFVNNVSCKKEWTTTERDSGMTRGTIRVRHAEVNIDINGHAVIT